MDNPLLFAMLGGLGAMLGWGTTDFLAKKAVDKIGNASALFWMQFVGFFSLLLLSPFQLDTSDLTLSNTILTAFWAMISAAGHLLFFNALEKGKVSIISPIGASYAAFSIIVSSIVFSEMITPLTLVLLVLIFVGILLISLDFQELRRDVIREHHFVDGIPQAITAVVFFAFWFPFWDDFVSKGNSWFTLLISLRAFVVIFLFLYTKFRSISLRVNDSEISHRLIFMGLLDVGAFLALTWGYGESSYTSVVSTLSAAFPLPTLILARVFLKERLKMTQWIGVVTIIGSLMLWPLLA